MASRGLFSYDSDDYTYKYRSYVRITIPKRGLKLYELPQEIRNILDNFRMLKINFAVDSIITEEITNKL